MQKKQKKKQGEDKLLEAHLSETLGDGSSRTNNWDLECRYIGTAFKRPSELQSITSLVSADDFADPRNKVFFRFLRDCYKSGKYPDYDVCLATAIRDNEFEIEASDYRDALNKCLEGDASLDIESASGIIHDLYVVRKLLGLAKRIEANVAQGKSSADVVAQAETIFKSLSTDLYSEETLRDIDELIDNLAGGMEEYLQPATKSIPTPWPDLNDYIGGFKPKQLYIIGARPGVGKTAFLVQAAYHAALYDPAFKVALFSLEMDALDVWQRILCAQVGITSDDFNQGALSKEDKEHIREYYRKAARRNIYMSDRGGKTPMALRSEVARFKAKHGRIDMLLVDYLQLQKIPGSKSSERTQEVGAIAKSLKEIAMEFAIPVIVSAQTSREYLKKGGQESRPSLPDLRESGDIEACADVVIFPYRPSMGWTKTTPPPSDEFIIAKHRRGKCGEVQVKYIGSQFKFVSASD